ncbi:hypothetical protein GCM10007907_02680 [Chitinimonas prasina]|uniref:Uncharacterized protein n=1 Tax=Chitinimonas prasina TaxID=1434937 RepID=A0ABQ5YBS1_9NEIS|nr:hypothetical protein GCM10007907_02680 [Chitinimonas prasina]
MEEDEQIHILLAEDNQPDAKLTMYGLRSTSANTIMGRKSWATCSARANTSIWTQPCPA